ncbi:MULTISPECIES: hypothetical protein [unclassified Microbacterium]|uniref:hypothetical protein n=1 Tax=unclassified Microbacterium TaxID=2609290 RepID=UPI0030186914
MRALARAVVAAVGSGRFLTVWSIAITLPLSLTVMAPVGVGIESLPALLATWLCFAAGLTAIALRERRRLTTSVRAAVVLTGIVLCGALRPVVQDAWLRLAGIDTPLVDQLPFRIVTNLVVWLLVLSVIAVIEGSLHALRRTNALLRSVATALTQAQTRAAAFAQEARDLVAEAVVALDAAIDDVPGSSAGVRRLGAEQLRSWSHRLASFAEEGGVLRAGDGPGATRRSEPLPRRLSVRVPPRAVVTVVYAASLLPYAARTQEPIDLLTGVVVLVVGGAVVDALPRHRRISRNPGRATGLFLLLSAGLGLALSALAIAQGVRPLLAAVSAVAYLGFALAASFCAGALHDLRRERRRLSGAVADAQHAARAGTRPTREGLRGAAELLHRDGQGACIVFALAHPAPTTDELQRLRHDLHTVIDRLPQTFSAAPGPGGQVSLTGLFDTWAHVIALRIDIDDASRAALGAVPWIARDTYDVVAEGLLNVAKHGSGRQAEVSLRQVATGAGPQVRVRVWSPGAVAPSAVLRPSSRMHELGARLLPGAEGMTLEASFPVAAARAVASAEHRG